MSSLTKTQSLQIEPSEKRTHTNESVMLKMFYLYGFVRWTKCIWLAIENNYLLVYKLLEFAVKTISAVRNKAEIVFSSQNHLHYYNFFLIWIQSMQEWTRKAWQERKTRKTTTRHGVTRKRSTKRLKHTRNLFRKNLQLKTVFQL